jgi:hypothetical protein
MIELTPFRVATSIISQIGRLSTNILKEFDS